ncbi:hypothetical protein [Paracoccus aestuariivivens]|uniref:Uncharacterized protein n=1 Tax=Paracoccus aestuariivivens TaxID=1820333 RepID=A0A6L6JHX6_9RHOB|nr:hypothetical protein [Paracoccus aestuariivivens]MTH80329.1 hypothetical protein [Paracoccus aestuariivivens]
MFKAAIRVNKIKTVAQLRGATLHAERHDEIGKARVREGAVPGEALAWSKAEASDRDYLAAFKAHKAEMQAGERKNAPLAMQALCVVSPEWVQAVGDLHDRDNPRNIALFDQAKAWAESWAGKGAVFGARLDLDEKGGAVVDLMIAPVRNSRAKLVISTQKALVDLKAATGERNEYAALQTSWAEWCRAHLDQNITRGLRRELTGREHLSPETYGQVMDKAREAVQRPAESLLGVLQAVDLSSGETELLRDYLLLRGEISRHREDPRSYAPPKGEVDQEWVASTAPETQDPWKLISAFRKGAEYILTAAQRFGVGLDELRRPDGHEAGRKWFPVLADRLHLGAVVAKCGAFCAHAEAFVKNLQQSDSSRKLYQDQLWPHNATELVARYNRHLGLDFPQHVTTEQKRDRGVSQRQEVVKFDHRSGRTGTTQQRDKDDGWER